MRVEAGCFKSKVDKNGAPYYLHRLTDIPRAGTCEPPRRPGPDAMRADADTLHTVYSELLGRLTLSKVHREAMHCRGLTEEAIERNGYKTLPIQGRPRIVRDFRERFGDKLLSVPGIIIKEGPSGRYFTVRGPAGLIVPCRDRAGRIVALKVRRDNAGESGPRYFYCSSTGYGGPGPGAPVHVPVGTSETAELVRLTEGELKADIIQALTGLPSISVPGVGTWQPSLAVLKELGCKTVRLAFDADASDNPIVARALSACAPALIVAGFAVELERWDPSDGKGLDDLLVAGKTPELLQGEAALQTVRDILASATADEEPAPSDELARLQDVLDAGGPEALFRDKALMQALAKVAVADPTRFAAVRASIRQRVSISDLDKALRPLRREAMHQVGGGSPAYFEQHGCIHRNVQTREGPPVPVALCNFSARIVEEVIYDDGAEQTRYLAVRGTLADGTPLPVSEIPAADFASMNWTLSAWGTRAVVYAGMGMKDHLRVALQLLSGEVPRRTVFRHLGWRQIGDVWFYLHAGGAIGPDGFLDAIPVSLPEPLAGFRLPAPPKGTELINAVRASLGFLRLGPDRLTFPLLAAAYRAVLGDTDFGIHLSGPTGCYKSEAAALLQQHFGAGMDRLHLPGNWASTGNALEGLAFAAKDSLMVVDDFSPQGSAADVQRYHREADRLFRGQGNRSGRLRMRADATLRPAKAPRGLVLSTGEDVPRGQSVRARLPVFEISPGDFGPQPPTPNPTLTILQRDAGAGLYEAAMAGFVHWLAPQYDEVHGRLRVEMAELRDKARGDGQHARTPGIVADLALGLRYLLDFARSAGAVSETERIDVWERGWRALAEAAAAQVAHVAAAEPAMQFLRLLSAALASGRAHVADPDGLIPKEPERWGWRLQGIGGGENAHDEWRPQGHLIGWTDGENLYLEPEAAYAEAQRLAVEQGESLPVTQQTLRRRLKEKALLASSDDRRHKLTIRKTLQGARREVLHLTLTPGSPLHGTGPTGPETHNPRENGPVPGAGPGVGNGQAAQESAHNHRENGELGRLGRYKGEGAETASGNSTVQRGSGWDEA
jgi:hypothetical protein